MKGFIYEGIHLWRNSFMKGFIYEGIHFLKDSFLKGLFLKGFIWKKGQLGVSEKKMSGKISLDFLKR